MSSPNFITDHSREETAIKEVGFTSVTTRLRVWVIAVFLTSICGIVMLRVLHGGSADLPPGKATSAHSVAPAASDNEARAAGSDFFRGVAHIMAINDSVKQRLRVYERSLEENSLLSRWTLPWLQAFSCSFLGQGNEKVYIGRDGWLFYRPDVDHLLGKGFLLDQKNATGTASDPIPALIRFKEDLEARGIRLLVVPVPAKPAIAPMFLSPRFSGTDAPLENPSYPVFLQRLRSHGINVLDLSFPLSQPTTNSGGPCYLKTDTHWTPEGMEHAAALVAQRIRETTDQWSHDPEAFHHGPVVSVTNRGDLATMLKLPPDTGLYPREKVTIHPVVDSQGDAWKPIPSSEVLVLGDSFTRIYSGEDLGWGTGAGFAEQLSFHLRHPVDVLAINAGGASSTRQALARSPGRLAGIRTVVYEFAMRELTSGDWRVIPISPEAAAKPASNPAPLVIEGTIAGITAPPSSSPYPDVIISIHLRNVRGARDDEALVFVHGIRNHVPTGASSLRPGDSVSLRVVPWALKEAELGSIQRIEPTNSAADLTEVYWSDDYSVLP